MLWKDQFSFFKMTKTFILSTDPHDIAGDKNWYRKMEMTKTYETFHKIM